MVIGSFFVGPYFTDTAPKTVVSAVSLTTYEWEVITTAGTVPDPLIMFKKMPLHFIYKDDVYILYSNSNLPASRMDKLNLKTFTWSQVSMQGSPPPARDYQSGGIHGDSLFLYSIVKGGQEQPQPHHHQQQQQQQQPHQQQVQQPNSHHHHHHQSQQSLPQQQTHFPGTTAEFHNNSLHVVSLLNPTESNYVLKESLHRYDFTTGIWHSIQCTGVGPSYPSSGTIVYRGKLQVFSKHSNKLHSLCLNTGVWSIAQIGPLPDFSSKRHSHLIRAHEDRLYLIRACDQFQLYSFDFNTLIWERAETSGKRPHSVRTEATTVIHGDLLFALGGQGGNNPQNHLYCMRLKSPPKESEQLWLASMMNDDFTDVTFVLEGSRKIRAHRCILAARSAYFAAMFTGRFREGISGSHNQNHQDQASSDQSKEIAIEDVAFSVFEALLMHYYDKLDLPNCAVDELELFEAACRFLNENLQSEIANHISKNLMVENVLQVYKAASEMPTEVSKSLKDKAAQFIWTHFTEVSLTPTFLEMCQNQSLLIQELCAGMGKHQPQIKRLKIY